MTSRDPEPYQPLISSLPGEWVREAACAESFHKDAFHPSSDDGRDAAAESRYAKAVCNLCPVKVECQVWAFEVGPELARGILGGLSEYERRKMLGMAA